MFKKILRELIKAISFIAIALIILALCGWLWFRITLALTKPKTEDFLSYANDTYQKEFVLVRKFSYTDYTDGEKPLPIRWCPAVTLEDPETGINFNIYASSILGWHFRDNFSYKVLLYCLEEEGIERDEEEAMPVLYLENSKECARKLQKMVIHYNEIYSVDRSKTCHTSEGFMVPGSSGSYCLFQIIAGNVNDRWLDQTSPFCYDTPLEKYEAFLKEVVG